MGWRYGRMSTVEPTPTREVAAAAHVSVITGS
jgi:hypothetical protein